MIDWKFHSECFYGENHIKSFNSNACIAGNAREVDCSVETNDVSDDCCKSAREIIVSDELFEILAV